MSAILSLAWQSLMNRKGSVLLTLLAVALSVALFLGVDKARTGAREGFGNTISGTELIVGALAALFGLSNGQRDSRNFVADLSGDRHAAGYRLGCSALPRRQPSRIPRHGHNARIF